MENDLNDKKSLDGYFEDIFTKLAIEHNLKEASFKHQLDLNKIITPDSPYQSIFNENDELGQKEGTFTLLNGDNLCRTENKTLENCLLPGINNRYGMPQKPPQH